MKIYKIAGDNLQSLAPLIDYRIRNGDTYRDIKPRKNGEG